MIKTINLQKESEFIHSEKTNTSDKEGLLFQLLNIAQVLLSDYAIAETNKLRSFYKIVYLKTKKFYIEKSNN